MKPKEHVCPIEKKCTDPIMLDKAILGEHLNRKAPILSNAIFDDVVTHPKQGRLHNA